MIITIKTSNVKKHISMKNKIVKIFVAINFFIFTAHQHVFFTINNYFIFSIYN